MVTTINGKITRGDDPDIKKWTSDEDSKHFHGLMDQSKVVIMGKTTYEAAKAFIKNKAGRLRVIMTHKPQDNGADAVAHQLEFSNMSPSDMVRDLEKRGYTEALLIGGGKVNSSFLKENLIDKIILTIEPYLFGKGKELFFEEQVFTNLRLVSTKQLNDRGTLLLEYDVLKEY